MNADRLCQCCGKCKDSWGTPASFRGAHNLNGKGYIYIMRIIMNTTNIYIALLVYKIFFIY